MDINTVDFIEELAALPKLTARQSEILDLITNAIGDSGLPPTRAEIATQLGFAIVVTTQFVPTCVTFRNALFPPSAT